MNVFIGPVSGAKFPAQIALYMELYKIIEPDLILGSSGGCVASFVYLAADGTPESIERICRSLNNRLLTSNWWNSTLDFLPSSIIGFFKGTIYSKGQGTDELMNKIFSTYNISRIEMLIGTTNRESGMQQIFSNRSKEDSIMRDIPFDSKMNNSLPIKYAKADINKISKICTASATIPVLFQDEKIDDQYYIDGGTTFTSPLTPLCDSLDFIGSNKKLHLLYLNSFNIESSLEESKYYNLVQNTDQTLSTVLRSLAIQDRLKGIELIKKSIYRNKLNLLYFEGKCNTDVLKLIEKVKKKCVRSFLELYTPTKNELDLTDFNFKSIMDIVVLVRSNYCFRIWLACKNKYKDDISKILNEFKVAEDSRTAINSENKNECDSD
jgi:hypothetical protein